ncbi:MAG: hypothetical protein V1887_04085 [Candidatus Aenigmatarchaeota archaeon]
MEAAAKPAEVTYRFKGAGDDTNKQNLLASYFRGLMDDGTIDEIHLSYNGTDLRVKLTIKGTLPGNVETSLRDHYHGEKEK